MQKEHDLDCPKCCGSIVKSYGDETKLRAKLVKWDRNGMYAVCKSCNTEVPVSHDLFKSIEASFVYEVKKDA